MLGCTINTEENFLFQLKHRAPIKRQISRKQSFSRNRAPRMTEF